ncbi:PdaC/SigV domain-containing protein [Sphingobium phenoxybenzoativorans]|uniref:PdaC/SigV domain-containing protein n=1 Tax=Sphingobium phenoxybenzoativorans TaxID=1592790 RepID=UPI000871BB83|nr:DUF4163 domain-containing protein [Sphingobium phenoxybenzoativorans]
MIGAPERVRRRLALVCVLLAAACSGPSGPAGNDAGNDSVNAADAIGSNAAATNAAAPAAPAKPFKLEDKSEALEFSYAYPAQAAAIPAVAEKLTGQMDKAKADALKAAAEDQKSAKEADYPFRQHSLQTTWTVHADTPRFLGLVGETYVYTGGAHGMTAWSGLLWDKQAAKDIPVTALMTSPAAFAASMSGRFCDALDDARAEKRGEKVKRGADDFSICVDPMQQVLTPEAGKGGGIDRIRVIIGPYEAGPYAEGSYEIDVPVDAAMIKAIKPEYRAAFVAGR